MCESNDAQMAHLLCDNHNADVTQFFFSLFHFVLGTVNPQAMLFRHSYTCCCMLLFRVNFDQCIEIV